MSPAPVEPDDNVDQEQPFISHLLELRDRTVRAVLAILVVFVCLAPFANELYTALAGPLTAHLPEGTSMVAIKVISPFLTPFKLTLVMAIYIAVPFLLYQMWAFVAPGLYRHEKRMVWPLLISSTILFYLGMAFAYYVVFPLMFGFLTATGPEGVAVTPDISEYLDFVLTVFLAFGVAFEVPIATILLVWTGMVEPDSLREKRPYVVVGAFIVGMLLTPPDIISQTLLAIPMWLLYELGIIFSVWFRPKKPDTDDVSDDTPSATRDGATVAGAASATASAGAATTGSAEDSADLGEYYQHMIEAEMDKELDDMEAWENEDYDDEPTSSHGDDESVPTPEPETDDDNPDEYNYGGVEYDSKGNPIRKPQDDP
ncbi:MAG: twin-arginine translocase subunit TatC [Gammaproteobacteria bacterium]